MVFTADKWDWAIINMVYYQKKILDWILINESVNKF